MNAPQMKLGKLPFRQDRLNRTMQYGKYLTKTITNLPSIPVNSDFPNAAPLGMLLNDELGCCVPAQMFHSRMIWNKAHGKIYTPTDAEVLAAYEAIGGYIPGNENTDNGCDMLTAMNYWRQTGIGNDKNKITAFVQVDFTNQYELQHASYFFGGLSVGIQLPMAAQSMNNTKFGWTNPPTSLTGQWAPGSWGGHDFCVAGMGQKHVDAITWGERIPAEWGFWNGYVDEVYAIISPEYIPDPTVTIDGFNMTQLLDDVADATA